MKIQLTKFVGAVKAVFRGELIALNANIRKLKRCKIHNLQFTLSN